MHLTEYGTRDDALKRFWGTYSRLKKRFQTSITLRNEFGSSARGTIKVEIDGFYYYVELYKNE
jgi:hypothetical protein